MAASFACVVTRSTCITKVKMASSICEEMKVELEYVRPGSHAHRLLTQEIDRITKGTEADDQSKSAESGDRPSIPTFVLHSQGPRKCVVKALFPVKAYPNCNFAKILLGPNGTTIKELQDQTGCTITIKGKGSVRGKEKEEELRQQGGEYAHLNEDLHCLVKCYIDGPDGYRRLGAALTELRNMVIRELAYGGGDRRGGMGGASRGRGRGGSFRASPPRNNEKSGGYDAGDSWGNRENSAPPTADAAQGGRFHPYISSQA